MVASGKDANEIIGELFERFGALDDDIVPAERAIEAVIQKEVELFQQAAALGDQVGAALEGALIGEKTIDLEALRKGRQSLAEYLTELQREVELTALTEDQRERATAALEAESLAVEAGLATREDETDAILAGITTREELLDRVEQLVRDQQAAAEAASVEADAQRQAEAAAKRRADALGGLIKRVADLVEESRDLALALDGVPEDLRREAAAIRSAFGEFGSAGASLPALGVLSAFTAQLQLVADARRRLAESEAADEREAFVKALEDETELLKLNADEREIEEERRRAAALALGLEVDAQQAFLDRVQRAIEDRQRLRREQEAGQRTIEDTIALLESEADQAERAGDRVDDLLQRGDMANLPAALEAAERATTLLRDGATRAAGEVAALLSAEGVTPELESEVEDALAKIRELSEVEFSVQLGLVDAVDSEAERALRELDLLQREIADKLRAGLLTPAQAAEATAAVGSAFAEQFGQIGILVDDLAERFPDLGDAISSLREQLRRDGVGVALALSEDIGAALDELNQARGEIRDQAGRGLIGGEEITRLEADALDRFRLRLEAVGVAIDELAQRSPTLSAELAVLRDRVRALREETAPEIVDDAGAFFDGLAQGVRSVTNEANDLAAAGANVGRTFIDGLATGIVDTLVRANQSFQTFLGNFLAGIAVMLGRLALLRTFGSLFSFANQGGAVAANLGGLVRPSSSPAVGPCQARA